MKLFVLKLASVLQFQVISYTRFCSADLSICCWVFCQWVILICCWLWLKSVEEKWQQFPFSSFSFFSWIHFFCPSFEIRKVRSNSLDLFLAFLLHLVVIRYTRIQSAYLLNCTRVLYHWARPILGSCSFVLSNSSLKTFQFLFSRIQGVCPNLIDLYK